VKTFYVKVINNDGSVTNFDNLNSMSGMRIFLPFLVLNVSLCLII